MQLILQDYKYNVLTWKIHDVQQEIVVTSV